MIRVFILPNSSFGSHNSHCVIVMPCYSDVVSNPWKHLPSAQNWSCTEEDLLSTPTCSLGLRSIIYYIQGVKIIIFSSTKFYAYTCNYYRCVMCCCYFYYCVYGQKDTIWFLFHLDPRAAELAAGRRPEKKCGLAAGKIAASRQPGRKKYAA